MRCTVSDEQEAKGDQCARDDTNETLPGEVVLRHNCDVFGHLPLSFVALKVYVVHRNVSSFRHSRSRHRFLRVVLLCRTTVLQQTRDLDEKSVS